MKTITSVISILTIMILTLTTSNSFSQSIATYTVTFNSVWNSSDHGTLPSNAHWSKLVGATHNANVTFVQLGQIASAGIEKVAEEGDNVLFNSEVNTSIASGNANQYIDGNDLPAATGNIVITDLHVNENFPLLTLVSMIAPSPDWMIAINGLNLRENNDWKTQIVLDLFGYDAGTDNGVDYTSPDSDTNPKQPISSLRNVAPFNSEKIGTITVQLESVLAVESQIPIANIRVFPNPSNGQVTIGNIQNVDLETVSVYTIQGRLVKHTRIALNDKEVSFNLTDLNSGIYILKLTNSKGQSIIQKLILD